MKTELWIRCLLRRRPRAEPVLEIGEIEHLKDIARRHVIEPMSQGGQHPVIARQIKTPKQPLRR